MPRTPRERLALALWVLLAIFVGNGIYDVLVARGIKEFLFRHALSEAGAGPVVPLAPLMHTTVVRATGVGHPLGRSRAPRRLRDDSTRSSRTRIVVGIRDPWSGIRKTL